MENAISRLSCKFQNNFCLKAERVLEFLIFKSKLFISMTVDENIEFLKELCVVMKWGNVTISSGIICFANARKYFEKNTTNNGLYIFFYTNIFYGVILSLLYKPSYYVGVPENSV